MSALVWEIRKRHGWASMRTPMNQVFDSCHVYQVDNGLWVGEYTANDHTGYTPFPGEYPLEELKAILETTVTLLEAQ